MRRDADHAGDYGLELRGGALHRREPHLLPAAAMALAWRFASARAEPQRLSHLYRASALLNLLLPRNTTVRITTSERAACHTDISAWRSARAARSPYSSIKHLHNVLPALAERAHSGNVIAVAVVKPAPAASNKHTYKNVAVKA